MKKKLILGTVLAASIALSATFSGCSLVSKNNTSDMHQVIAEVNISRAEKASQTDKELFETCKDAVGTSYIYKSKLVAYYLNVGYSYVQQGYPTSYVFDMLVDGLVENSVVNQYAIMYLLNYRLTNGDTNVLEEYSAQSGASDTETYVKKLEYLLGYDYEGSGEDTQKNVNIAKYNLYYSLNASIDSYERQLLEDEEDEAGTETRTTPGGVDTETDEYYPKAEGKTAEGFEDGDLYYNVYTGYNNYLLGDSGAYQEEQVLDGTYRYSRNKAYVNFLGTLVSFGLVNADTDNLLDVMSIPYMQEEYASQLESRVVAVYNDLFEKSQESRLNDNERYEYLQERYQLQLDEQKRNYKTTSTFGGVIGNISDTSFILYSPSTEGEGIYGLVYNILLPFDSRQSSRLTNLKSQYTDKDTGGYTYEYYAGRNEELRKIVTTDQRSAWFNGQTDYSFKPEASYDYYGKDAGREYLFFENNVTKSGQYEQLDKYIGSYSYNGSVYEQENGKYLLVPEKLTIDGMLSEFEAYVNYVLGDSAVTFEDGYEAGKENAAYYANLTADNFYTEDTKDKKPAEREINYENYIYAKGKISLTDSGKDYRNNLLDKESRDYKALAAVNELQYAYTTDTGILSNYLGYSVTLGDSTGYIKEFETAAHEAISRGAGAFNVCAGDYGWHLIYVTYTFGEDTDGDASSDGGEQYSPVWTPERVNKEGTFENLFYEYVKSTDISSITSKRRSQILSSFNLESTVSRYSNNYQDLLS